MPIMRERAKTRIPVGSKAAAKVSNDGHQDFDAVAASILKQDAVGLALLPWLTEFTYRVVRATREEERNAILALVPQPADDPDPDRWSQGYAAAVRTIRASVLRRCDRSEDEA